MGTPDANTFRYVLMKITPEKVHAVFSEWMKSILSNVHGIVAIDGKQARRTADPQKRPLHVVSAFAHEFGLVLGQIACEENGSVSEQRHYFIYSCKNLSAKEIMKAKRAHWGIENSLHWVLDMSFREDESRARKDHSAENFNALRHLAYNILKSDTSFKGSFPDKQFKCMLDTAYLDTVLFSAFS